MEVIQSKLVFKFFWLDLFWPLLTGSRYSDLAVRTVLTVPKFGFILKQIPKKAQQIKTKTYAKVNNEVNFVNNLFYHFHVVKQIFNTKGPFK
jgi:hypothetical protein